MRVTKTFSLFLTSHFLSFFLINMLRPKDFSKVNPNLSYSLLIFSLKSLTNTILHHTNSPFTLFGISSSLLICTFSFPIQVSSFLCYKVVYNSFNWRWWISNQFPKKIVNRLLIRLLRVRFYYLQFLYLF